MQKQTESSFFNLGEAERAQRMGKLGMGVLIISLSILFAATILGLTVAYISPTYRKPETPVSFPLGFYISTLIIIISSFTMSRAVRIARSSVDNYVNPSSTLSHTLLLGCIFVVMQGFNWGQLIREQITPYTPDLFVFSLYILTILHLLHVIGGLIPLISLAKRSKRGDRSAVLTGSIESAATYWHFLAVVWYVVVVVLLFICYSR